MVLRRSHPSWIPASLQPLQVGSPLSPLAKCGYTESLHKTSTDVRIGLGVEEGLNDVEWQRFSAGLWLGAGELAVGLSLD